MSYILEALKKSDKDRQRENVPDLQADHSQQPVGRDERKPSGWHLSLIIILLCSGGLLWWPMFGDQKPQLAEEAPQVIPVSSVPSSQVSDLSGIPSESIEASSGIKGQINREVKQAVVLASQDASPVATVSEQNPASRKQTAQRVVHVQEEAVPPLLEELPFVIRGGIPDLTFAGHVYADDARKRLIMINNRIVREGDLIADGLSLEQIIPNGVVLRYETTVFRVVLF